LPEEHEMPLINNNLYFAGGKDNKFKVEALEVYGLVFKQ
jgi:hypothetical protein